jgi:hypothetical protein
MKQNIDRFYPILPVFLGLVIVVALLFSPVLFGGKIFGSPDSLSPKASSMILEKVHHQTGEFPLWQPWIFSGMPTAEAFTYVGQLYFPGYLLHLLFVRGLFSILIHLVLAGVGGYVLLRYLKLSPLTAFLGGAGFMMMPYLVTMVVFGHGSQMMTAAYIPWVMWAVMRLYDRPSLLNASILALALGSQLQRAHAQIAYYTWMLVGAYVAYQLILMIVKKQEKPQVLRATGLFSLGAILAIGIAWLIYFPAMQYAPYSIRGSGTTGGAEFQYATSWSFHPSEMLTFLIPSAYGFGGQAYWGHMPFTDYPNYMGIVILLLAIYCVIRRKEPLVWFFAVTSILALLVSFGKHFSPVYSLFYHVLPYFNKFRVPSMILVLLQFNVAILAALGLENLMQLRVKSVPRWVWIGGGVIAFWAALLLFGEGAIKSMVSAHFTAVRTQDPRTVQIINNLRWELWYQDAWFMILFVGIALGATYMWFAGKIKQQFFVAGIVLLSIVDLLVVDHKIVQPGPRSGRASQLISRQALQRHFEPDEVIDFLLRDREQPFRIYPVGILFSEARFKGFGIESVGGYHPVKLSVYNRFLEKTRNAGTLPLMRMLNVRYLVSAQTIEHPDLIPEMTGRFRSGRGEMLVTVYRLKASLPRAWFVKKVQYLSNPDLLWTSITQSTFAPDSVAYITEPLDLPEGLGAGEVKDIYTSIHHITMTTTAEQPGFLVVSEVDYPLRWKAMIDGKPAETMRTNGVLRGLVVPAGEHTVEFIYDRTAFRTGVIVSVISFLVSLGFVGVGIVLNRRK